MPAQGPAYVSSEVMVFAGRERGSYERDGHAFPLDIRTTRIFACVPAQEAGIKSTITARLAPLNERLARSVQVVLGS